MSNAKPETSNSSKDDTCWTCGLDRQGAGAAHDCIQALKQVNKDLKEMLIELLKR